MAFPPAFLEELRARLPLSEVVGKRLRLIRAGREYSAVCPFHTEKSPSFTVNDQKGFFHCFGCGAHGDVIGFVMRHDHLSFPEAVESLAGLAGLPVPRTAPEERQRFERQKSLHEAVESATRWFEQQLRQPAGAAALAYLRRRGLDDESIATFRLGYAPPDGQALRHALERDGFAMPDLLEAGLLKASSYGAPFSFFRHRVMFPVADARGRIVAFGGRLLEGDGPKYINTGETPLFHKGQLLYGLSRARQAAAEGQAVVVVEGYMDVIALVRAGWPGAVAPLGTALTETQIATLWKLFPGRERVPVLCFDGDTAGRRAAWRAIERILPLLLPDHSVRVAFLPAGEDPDSLIRSRGTTAMATVLAQALPLAESLWQMETENRRFDSPEARAGLKAALQARVGQIADRDVQSFYRSEVGRRISAAFWTRPEPVKKGSGALGRPGSAGRGRSAAAAPTPLPTRTRTPSQHWPRILLATLINHPELLDDYHERLALTEVGDPELDRLRVALLDIGDPEHPASPATDPATAADDPADNLAAQRRSTLLDRLQALGFHEVISDLLSEPTYSLAGFARPHAEREQARLGLSDGYATLSKSQVSRDLLAAGRVLGRDFSERNLSRVVLLRQELASPEPAGAEPVTGSEAGTGDRDL